jgi:hypothetical protein
VPATSRNISARVKKPAKAMRMPKKDCVARSVADDVVEVDRGEREVEALPEPEDQHRSQQEPYSPV